MEEKVVPRLSHQYDNGTAWKERMGNYKNRNGRLWIILSVSRRPNAKELEDWLLKNATLVWRKLEVRYDYTVRGIEIFLVSGSPNPN